MAKPFRFAAFVIATLFSAMPASANISEAIFTPQGSEVYPSTPESSVEVYVYTPEFSFKVIGAIEARGMAGGGGGNLLDGLDITNLLDGPPGEKEDMALAIRALKREAARVGATGVIILQSTQVRVSPSATERRISGAAIIRLP
jgi:hypothetical protein